VIKDLKASKAPQAIPADLPARRVNRGLKAKWVLPARKAKSVR
jgi:hypothetical protein